MLKQSDARKGQFAVSEFRQDPIALAAKHVGVPQSRSWVSKAFITATALSALAQPVFAAPGDPAVCEEGAQNPSLVCGFGNTATGVNAVASGVNNSATGLNAIAVGNQNLSSGVRSTAVGSGNTASAVDSSAFGRNNSVGGGNSTVVGMSNTIAAGGTYDKTPGDGGTTVHWNNRSVAVGYQNTIDMTLGDGANHEGTAVGVYNKVVGEQGVAMGWTNHALGEHTTGVGVQNTVYGRNSSAVGMGNTVGDVANNVAGVNYQANAFGSMNSASAMASTALGNGNVASGQKSLAAGNQSVAAGESSIALGSDARINSATSTSAIAIGTSSRALSEKSIAVGANAQVSGSVAEGVAIGAGAVVNAAALNSAALGAGSVTSRANTLSIGNATTQRQIIFVAPGTAQTDAVNVSQLKGVTDALGGGASIDGATGVVNGPTYVINGSNYTTVEAALQAAAASGGGGGGNLLVDASKNTWSSNSLAPVAGVNNTVALGAGAVANEGNSSSTAIGSNAQATGAGSGSIALGRDALAIGGGKTTQDIRNETTDSAGVTSVGNPLLAIGAAVATDVGTTATATAIGRNSAVLGAGSVGIGNHTVVTGPRSVAVGAYSAATGFRSTALGDHAFAQGEQSIAIGSDSGDNGVVGAHAAGKHSIAIGSDTSATEERSVVIGLNATATTAGSVALGANSLADRANVVSVGKAGAGNQRQIIYVAAGTADTDAVNVSQLKGVASLIGGGVAVDPATGAVSNTITVGGNTYNTIQEAIENAAGGGNPLAVAYNDADKDTISLQGKSGSTLITNLSDGAVSATSTDAINGSQLYEVRSGLGQQLATSLGGGASYDAATGVFTAPQYGITAGSGSGKFDNVGAAFGAVDTALNELDDEIAAIGNSAVQYDDATKSQITLGGAGAAQPTLITNLKDGAIDSKSSDAINGSQLYSIADSIAVDVLGGGAVVNPDGTITGPTYSIGGGSQTTIADAFDAVDDELTDLNNQVGGLLNDALLWDSGLNAYSAFRGGVAQKITGVAAGAVTSTSTDAVNGSQLHGTHQAVTAALGGGAGLNPDGSIKGPTYNVAGGTQTDVGGALTAIDDRITNEIAGLGNSAVQYDDPTTKDTITLGGTTSTDGGVTGGTKITNVAQGELSATSTDAVNGAQLHATNQQVAQNTAAIDALDDRVTDVEGDIVNLGNQITNITTDIGDINTAIDDLTTGKSGYCRRGTGDNSVECGEGADASIAADNAVAIGSNSAALGFGGVAVGNQAKAESAGSVAIGDGAYAKSSVAVGAGAQATGLKTTAIGDNAVASGDYSVALGNEATATAANSVALGNGSVADRANAVSVGSAGNERQIVNVAAGVEDTDAVNVSQLKAAQAGSVQYDRNPDTSINYNRITFGAPGGGGGPVTLANIADGVAPTDAVNLRQLNAMGDSLANWLDEIERDANAGIAAAVAMEAAPYLPGHITYALGTGYHVNQGAIGLTLRGTAENGRWSVSAGVAGSEAGTTVRVGVSGVLW
jgi:autotransporter adhesin